MNAHDRGGTPRRCEAYGFTAVVCHGRRCGGHAAGSRVIDGLRTVVRACPHGVLVSASCPLGRLTCAAVHTCLPAPRRTCPTTGEVPTQRSAGETQQPGDPEPAAGAERPASGRTVLIVTPCTPTSERVPRGLPRLVGPLTEPADTRLVAAWLATPHLHVAHLPDHLQLSERLVRQASTNCQHLAKAGPRARHMQGSVTRASSAAAVL